MAVCNFAPMRDEWYTDAPKGHFGPFDYHAATSDDNQQNAFQITRKNSGTDEVVMTARDWDKYIAAW